MADLSAVLEGSGVQVQHDSAGGSRRKSRAAHAAALQAFAPPTAPAPRDAALASLDAAPEASLDPRKVFSAARHGKHKEVEASLEAGFSPTTTDSFGNTLFHVACQNGNKRVAKLAIKHGGDMDAKNGKGNTGLHFLYAYGYPEIGEYFVEKGASADVVNEAGKLPREGIR